ALIVPAFTLADVTRRRQAPPSQAKMKAAFERAHKARFGFVDRTKELVIEAVSVERSEEHTSELQSRFDLVCRLLLEKKKNILISVQPRNQIDQRLNLASIHTLQLSIQSTRS